MNIKKIIIASAVAIAAVFSIQEVQAQHVNRRHTVTVRHRGPRPVVRHRTAVYHRRPVVRHARPVRRRAVHRRHGATVIIR